MEDQVKQLLSLGKSGILVSWVIQDLINRLCIVLIMMFIALLKRNHFYFMLDYVEGWCEHGTLIWHNNNDGVLFEWII